jgi:hypothetical protein
MGSMTQSMSIQHRQLLSKPSFLDAETKDTTYEPLGQITGRYDKLYAVGKRTSLTRVQLYPARKEDNIAILHHHLYQDPDEQDAETPAFSFRPSDIMAVIHRHESLQKLDDQKAKRSLADELSALSARDARKAKRQRRGNTV